MGTLPFNTLLLCRLVSGPLMLLNTFGAQMLASLAVGLMPALLQLGTEQNQARSTLHLAMLSHSAARGICVLMVLLCTFVLRSHIVVWAIVAPRFVFEAFNVGCMVACMTVLLVA